MGQKKNVFQNKKKKKKKEWHWMNEWPIRGETTRTIPGLANAGIW